MQIDRTKDPLYFHQEKTPVSIEYGNYPYNRPAGPPQREEKKKSEKKKKIGKERQGLSRLYKRPRPHQHVSAKT